MLSNKQLTSPLNPGHYWITASNRQARFWRREVYSDLQTSGRVLPSANILTWSAWLQHWFHEIALYRRVPMVIDPQLGFWLWQEMIRDSKISSDWLDSQRTAQLAYEAWQLCQSGHVSIEAVHQHGIKEYANQEYQNFYDWCKKYEQILKEKGAIDSHSLPHWLLQNTDKADLNKLAMESMDLIGFIEFTKVQSDLIYKLRDFGIDISEEAVQMDEQEVLINETHCYQFNDAKSELTHVVDWARDTMLQEPEAQLAIVVPDLSRRRQDIITLFNEYLHTDSLHKVGYASDIFNLSASLKLMDYPLTQVLWSLMQWMVQPIELKQLTRLLTSTWIQLPHDEKKACYDLAFALPEQSEKEWALEHFIDYLEVSEKWYLRLPHFIQHLKQMDSMMKATQYKAVAEYWIEQMEDYLSAWGWPGENSLESEAFQLNELLKKTMIGIRRLNQLYSTVTLNQCMTFFKNELYQIEFQPQSQTQRLQILGIYEAVNLQCDHIWITGLSSDALPSKVTKNPFLPSSLLKKYNLPGCGIQRDKKISERLLHALLRVSKNRHLSFYQQENEQYFFPSHILGLSQRLWTLVTGKASPLHALKKADLENFHDDFGYSYEGTRLSGGVSFLKQQAMCPFKAYLNFRLNIEEQEYFKIGIDLRKRGEWIHQGMQYIWSKLNNSDTLMKTNHNELYRIVEQSLRCIEKSELVNSSLLKTIEKNRAIHLMMNLLVIEKERTPFQVKAIEQDMVISMKNMDIHTRVDRVDELQDGSTVVIDYKTGVTYPGLWFSDRLGEPQMLLYAQAYQHSIAAIVYAEINSKETRFKGVASNQDVIPKVSALSQYDANYHNNDWPLFLQESKKKLDELVDEIQQGYAKVQPENQTLHACEYCCYASVCRINQQYEHPINHDDQQEHIQ